VYIIPFEPLGWGIKGVAKEYFAVEFALAYGFTIFMARELGEFMSMSDDATAYVSIVLYFTFTEFPEWYGGEIIHDPTYSAVAAMAAVSPESSSVSSGESSEEPTQPSSGGIPGFELLSVFLGILPIIALYRKRRN
ncbi:MAG: Heimdall-CTERM domain-containing surface protein, partial [Candidatus Thorarchaeota archaeon]